MKKLQNNFTTPEQSKRLLELGVPADSADCYYTPYGNISIIMPNQTDVPFIYEIGCTPCWSVGRLIEILEITSDALWSDYEVLGKSTLIERVLKDFEKLVKYNKIDFSKLEE